MTKPNKLPAQLAGNRDVPPSAWADPRRVEEHLPEGLVAVYTNAGGLVLDAVGAALIPAVTAGCRCVSFVSGERADLVEFLSTFDAEQRALGQVHQADVDEMAAAVSALTDEADLVFATCEVSCTADADSHAKIVTGATSAGLAFTRHLVAVSNAVLDEATAVEVSMDNGGRPPGVGVWWAARRGRRRRRRS